MSTPKHDTLGMTHALLADDTQRVGLFVESLPNPAPMAVTSASAFAEPPATPVLECRETESPARADKPCSLPEITATVRAVQDAFGAESLLLQLNRTAAPPKSRHNTGANSSQESKTKRK